MANNKKMKKKLAKAKSRITGKGDYSLSAPNDAVKAIHDVDKRLARLESKPSIGSTIGKKLGGMLGNGDLGASLGSMAENTMSKLFGFGDYSISSNSLMSAARVADKAGSNMVPMFGTHGRGIRVQEREYLGDLVSGPMVSGASAFTVQNFLINPANASSFPWLSQFAQNFEQWEPHGIVFEFVSTSSEYNGTSQALGTVVMATDYDVYDSTYLNKIEMETADYSNSTKPSCTALHGIECDPSERATKLLFVGIGQPDQRLNSLGAFQIASVGCSAANVNLGEVWVSYDVSFYKKQIGNTLPSAAYAFSSTDVANPYTLPLPIAATATDYAYPYENNLSLTFSGLNVYLPTYVVPGQAFMVNMGHTYSTASGQNCSFGVGTNCTLEQFGAVSLSATGMFQRCFIGKVLVTGPNPSFTITSPSGLLTQSRISITKVPWKYLPL